MMNGQEKSDSGVVAGKPANKAGKPAAEWGEPRPGTKGNADQQSTHRAQSRARVTQALGRVRQAARQKKKEQSTALLYHISVDTLRTAFYALKRQARPGVDGMTWQDYEADLELRIEDLHRRVQRSFTFLASPYICGRSRRGNFLASTEDPMRPHATDSGGDHALTFIAPPKRPTSLNCDVSGRADSR